MSYESKIPEIIPTQSFERVGDRLMQILMVEFENQKELRRANGLPNSEYDLLSRTSFFKEHFRTFNTVTSYALMLSMVDMDFDNLHPASATNSVTYYLDFMGGAASNSDKVGDQRTAENLQRLGGLVRYIISHPINLRLGFEPDVVTPIVENVTFKSFRRMEEVTVRTNLDSMMYRAIISIKVNETTDLISGNPLLESFTDITLKDTELGYQYLYNKN